MASKAVQTTIISMEMIDSKRTAKKKETPAPISSFRRSKSENSATLLKFVGALLTK